MKLKDIFNIDLSTRGGAKLYRKIMGKYNIPLKDAKDVKQEIVECSGDSDNSGNSDEQVIKYYKINTIYNDINYSDEWRELLIPFVKRVESISNYDAAIRTCLYSGVLTSSYGNNFYGIVTGDGENLTTKYVSDAWWTIADPYSGLFVNTLTSFLQDKTIDGIPNLLDCITEVSQKEFFNCVIS